MRVNVNGLIVWGAIALMSLAGPVFAAGDLRLVDAVKHRDIDAVRTLLNQRVDVNAPQPDGATALLFAVQSDDLEMVEPLIRAGANVKAANDYGITPLWVAARNGNPAMVER